MPQIASDVQTGPVSYTAGGITITSGLSNIGFALAECSSTVGSMLGSVRLEIERNAPAAGQFKIKVMSENYQRVTAIGALTGLPSGVTAASSSGQTYDANAAHVHSMAHDHAAATSTNEAASGGGAVLDAIGSKDIVGHNHSFDPPNFTGNTGAGSSHTHTWNELYDHTHALTNTQTDVTLTELTAGTDLSGAVFDWIASD